MAGIFDKFREGLTKTRSGLVEKIAAIVKGRALDDEFYEELEEILIQADVGVETSLNLVARVREEVARRKIKESE